MIIAFIDVFNALPEDGAAKIVDLIEGVVQRSVGAHAVRRIDFDVRLYGGWHEGASLTKQGQIISSIVQKEYPRSRKFTNPTGANTFCKINVTLADCLLSNPRYKFSHTYRKKRFNKQIRIQTVTELNCANTDCVLDLLRKSVSKQRCQRTGCDKSLHEALYKSEQKMVDTLMACDILGSVSSDFETRVIVSDDEDFLPVVKTLVDAGKKILWMTKSDPSSIRLPFVLEKNCEWVKL